MPTFNKFQDFTEQLLKGVHNFSGHTFKVALTNTPPSSANTVLADITQIAATGGYVAGGYALTGVVLTEAGGVAKVVINDQVVTASGGSVGPFQYWVVYNDTATGDPLVCWYTRDAGAVTLASGESITLDFDGSAGVFTLA